MENRFDRLYELLESINKTHLMSSVCIECHQEFKRPSDLKRHISVKHVVTKDFVCDLCPEDGRKNAFARLYTLRRHKRVQHNTGTNEKNAVRIKPRSLLKQHNMGINQENAATPKPNEIIPEGNTIFY